MGNCCSNVDNIEFTKQLSECQTIFDIATTMKYKTDEIIFENKEIEKLLANPFYDPIVKSIKAISRDDLIKRSSYLTQLKKCYIQSSEILEKKPYLNIYAVKEHMKELIELDLYLYDECDNYIKYIHSFLKFVEEEESARNTDVNDSETRHKHAFDNIIFYDELSLDSISRANSKFNI